MEQKVAYNSAIAITFVPLLPQVDMNMNKARRTCNCLPPLVESQLSSPLLSLDLSLRGADPSPSEVSLRLRRLYGVNSLTGPVC